MQKFLALTDVNFLDPLPALGDRAPRDYEKPVEPPKNLFREFEVGDYSLPEKQLGQKTTAPKSHYTNEEALQARKNAAARTGLSEARLSGRLGDYFAETKAWNGRTPDELNTLAYEFFETFGMGKKTAVRTATRDEVYRTAGTVARYAEAREAVMGNVSHFPTPEQFGAMLTWIEQNA